MRWVLEPALALRWILLGAAWGAATVPALAHPSAGIVVDAAKRVYFGDLSRGLLRLDPDGRVTRLDPEGGHWLALDEAGHFARADLRSSPHWPRWFKRKTPHDARPALIIDGGSPFAIGPDGTLYFACDDERLIPAGLQLGRVSPYGKESLVNPKLRPLSERLGGIKGLAIGTDGAIYATYPKAVLKIAATGEIMPLVNPVVAPDCDVAGPSHDAPSLRGIAVDARDVAWVVASGCRSVLRIAPGAGITTALKSEKPWVPAGVFVRGTDLYVLEHVDGNSEQHQDWPPRVRKLDSQGRVTILVDLTVANVEAR